MEQLVAAGFAKTAHLIGELVPDAAGRDELCAVIVAEHGKGAPGAPATPAGTDAKAKSEAPTPVAERDTSAVIAKVAGARPPRDARAPPPGRAPDLVHTQARECAPPLCAPDLAGRRHPEQA